MRFILSAFVVLSLMLVVYLPKSQAGHKSKSWSKVVTSSPDGRVSTSESSVQHRSKRGRTVTKWKTFSRSR